MSCLCFRAGRTDEKIKTSMTGLGNEEGPDMCVPISKEKRDRFNNTLLSLINDRRKKSDLKPLTLCSTLCKVARTVWNARAAQPHGLLFIPNCSAQVFVSVRRGDSPEWGIRCHFVDCISYTDNAIRSKWDLPEAALFYWTNFGRYTSTPGRLPVTDNVLTQLDEDIREKLLESQHQLLPMLLGLGDLANSRVGMHFGRLNWGASLGKSQQPYSIVAAFHEKNLADF